VDITVLKSTQEEGKTMGSKLKGLFWVLVCGIIFDFLSGAAMGADPTKPKVIVGSKNYTESFLAANLMSELLEYAGYPVERKLGLGGTAVIQQALVSGEIHIYAEYTGTALLAILKLPVKNDPNEVYQIVKDEYLKRFNLVWLKPIGFNDTYALAMKRERAKELNIKKISDLKEKGSKLILGATQEFLVRPDGMPGLEKKYGLKFQATKGMDPGLVYQAIQTNNADVISVFTTDGRIISFDLVALEDDLGNFPPYYLTPIVRKDLLDKSPEIADALNRLVGKINEDTMARLNLSVDQDKKDARQVAKDFLTKIGLIK
jgi:glycine betaine/choline ABC-type transport system substrate-binding protein